MTRNMQVIPASAFALLVTLGVMNFDSPQHAFDALLSAANGEGEPIYEDLPVVPAMTRPDNELASLVVTVQCQTPTRLADGLPSPSCDLGFEKITFNSFSGAAYSFGSNEISDMRQFDLERMRLQGIEYCRSIWADAMVAGTPFDTNSCFTIIESVAQSDGNG